MTIEKQLLLSLRPDISLVEQPEGVELRGYQLNIPLRKLPAGMSAVFRQLCVGSSTETELLALAIAQDGVAATLYFYQYLGRLANLLCHTLHDGERPFLTLIPQAFPSTYRFHSNLANPTQLYLLSRFAYLHREQEQLIVESPLGQVKLLLPDGRAAAWIAALAQPQTAETLLSLNPDFSPEFAGMFLNFLLNAQALSTLEAHGGSPEEGQETLAQWDFHDLLFHARSRLGRHNNPYGGTYPSKGRFTPLPVVKPAMSTEVISLDKPDLEQLKQTDLPFTAVLESRRSIRQYGQQPLTVGQLGEFLYRTARIKQMYQESGSEEGVSFRPYPGGGAIYELEIYPIVAQCEGLSAGLYHYNPLQHQLHHLADKNKQVQTLLHMAWLTANQESPPQVCLAITARFQRVQWKYEAMVYALILKHVGVLYQTMYLVATAMGLAPCALGGGNSDLFAAAAGLDYYAETTVGEFLLGSRPNS